MTPDDGTPSASPIRLRPQGAAAARRLAEALGLPAAVARVLAARGYAEPASARAFLEPSPAQLHDPFLMHGLPEAVARLLDSAGRGARLVVFGDYDCDGVGALAILTTVLRRLGADARPFIPHRLEDGYGLKPATLRRALEEHGPEGIVTVDCGITARETVEEATRSGVWVVVTDHHLPPEALPEGAVLVDPKLPGCPYPFKDLSGAGIAWKLAEGLLLRGGAAAGVRAGSHEAWRASLARIAALSTIADVVPLTGENRVLAAWGLAALADPRSPGLAALMRRAGIPPGRGPTSREVAFRIAPRLNAAGRLDHAYRALELLTTTDPSRAELLAEELEGANVERRALQERLVETVLAGAAGRFDPRRDAVVVEAGRADDGWHRGVLGIAAARVAERLRRPVLLFARDGDRLSGSGRTFGRTPLYARVAPVAARFATDFGGHDAALGLTIPATAWGPFREALHEAFAEARDDAEWESAAVADTEVTGPEVTAELVQALLPFEPHGAGNPRPIFLLRALHWNGRGRRIGSRGLRTEFFDGAARLEAIGWELAGLAETSRPPRVDVVAHVSRDALTGRPTLEVLEIGAAAA